MFSLRVFLKEGFLNAIGKMEDYQIKLNAAEWLHRGKLEEEDLAEIEAAIAANNVEEEADEPVEEESEE